MISKFNLAFSVFSSHLLFSWFSFFFLPFCSSFLLYSVFHCFYVTLIFLFIALDIACSPHLAHFPSRLLLCWTRHSPPWHVHGHSILAGRLRWKLREQTKYLYVCGRHPMKWLSEILLRQLLALYFPWPFCSQFVSISPVFSLLIYSRFSISHYLSPPIYNFQLDYETFPKTKNNHKWTIRLKIQPNSIQLLQFPASFRLFNSSFCNPRPTFLPRTTTPLIVPGYR